MAFVLAIERSSGVTRDLGRVGGSQAERWFGRWAGGFAALLLAIATPAAAFQRPPVATTAAPVSATPAVAAPKTYAECLRSYAGRTNATAYCQRLFPNATPAATTSSTTAPAGATSTPPPAPTTTPPTREPVDLSKLIEAWENRPKTPPPTTKPPPDPLAVIPEIQAACAAYARVPERWRRCAAEAWRKAGLRGEPPLVLQTPPVVASPPVVKPPPPVRPPPVQPPVVSKPPVQTPPPLTPKTVEPEPVRPVAVVEPELPPVAVVEPQSPPKPPPVVVPPPPKPPATPIWFWLVALVAAAAGGFGVAKLLSRARPPSRPPKGEAAPCTPGIALVADPGVVVLTPDGPPRAGMAVSLRIERDPDGGAVSLVDYPKLETAP